MRQEIKGLMKVAERLISLATQSGELRHHLSAGPTRVNARNASLTRGWLTTFTPLFERQ
jgi:hypothetical protein